uniref:PAS domain-containing protein n=1 Tax=Attheya septentrionalis TaxID=420275 RepID=A0A6T7HKI6_9STRA|mmetsp:Transcript_2139/g.3860  ORF Transcript_2139/g.3860 Transcript_2139/m.3860 type:complete len:914 (+) Transcript_2139:748-3489(+)|eukprot:CAMPEP_0198304304 /NCGR_PEP_ID=MMETSP1449-20131203/57333_1 /TAXON_ID=420275 /ORGANISM="Attheya septentrionalis, Strain CCMP2084" /LENGTH=913 /DNA_ID=CAMNT_0044006825 /DNA_START=1269 /DNA_END=4010 /DNA_ORIENTATION=+
MDSSFPPDFDSSLLDWDEVEYRCEKTSQSSKDGLLETSTEFQGQIGNGSWQSSSENGGSVTYSQSSFTAGSSFNSTTKQNENSNEKRTNAQMTDSLPFDFKAQMEKAMETINQHGLAYLQRQAHDGPEVPPSDPSATSKSPLRLPQHLMYEPGTGSQMEGAGSVSEINAASAAAIEAGMVYTGKLPENPLASGTNTDINNGKKRGEAQDKQKSSQTVSSRKNSGGSFHPAVVSNLTGVNAMSASKWSIPSTPAVEQKFDQIQTNEVNPRPPAMTSSSGCPPHIVADNKNPNQVVFPQIMFNPGVSNGQIMYLPQTAADQSALLFQQNQLQHGDMMTASLPLQPLKQVPTTMNGPEVDDSIVANATDSSQLKGKKSQQQQPPQVPPPPFYLFDAPCELRANFLKSQQMYNIPIVPDNNSYHYGMAVNGFHPQANATGHTQIASMPGGHENVQLLDGRTQTKKNNIRERNEREQKRAQKITDLIETLRQSMLKGGWKVEMKSKYHTLSTCADYMRHLIKTTEEQETAVEKAKCDLSLQRSKLQRQQASREPRSDRDSVTSSITISSVDNGDKSCNMEEGATKQKGSTEVVALASQNPEKIVKSSSTAINKHKRGREEDSSPAANSRGPRGRNISIAMMSTMSDITDNNRASPSGDRHPGKLRHHRSTNKSDSVTSETLIANAVGDGKKEGGFNESEAKKRSNQESYLGDNFVVDYQEAFISSNVPQIIATAAGRIVAFNKFFLKVAGLSEAEARSLTIFSIVQAEKLSSLFEMVATALRTTKVKDTNSNEASSSEKTTNSDNGVTSDEQQSSDDEVHAWSYNGVTLPCIPFNHKSRRKGTRHPNPLFMTVTLIRDEDPLKRCFHCILTDSPGKKGALGSVTPELLAMFFAENTVKQSKRRKSSSKRRKKDGCDDA